MSSKRKIVAVAITTVALTAGSLGVATAASKTSTKSRVTITKTTTKTISSKGNIGMNAGMDDHKAMLESVLTALVANGTLTADKKAAILSALDAAVAAEQANRPPKGAALAIDKAARDALISSTLGIDSVTVRARLVAGESLATIAGDKKAALISALVTFESNAIDAAVTASKITPEQATAMKANLTGRVTSMVNSVRQLDSQGGKKGKGKGKGKGRGHGQNHDGPMGGVPMGIPAPAGSQGN